MAAVEQEVVDKIIGDLKMAYERALEELRNTSHEQLKQAQGYSSERIEELAKQTDGLLGAIGRLQSERDQAVKKAEDLERETHQRDLDIQMKVREMNHQMEIDRTRDRERAQKEKDKETEERAGLKAKIANLEAKLARQRKK